MTNQLSQLKQMTTVVADTGDIEAIAKFQPQDATTNPSLLLKAASLESYQHLLKEAVSWAKEQSSNADQQVIDAADKHGEVRCRGISRSEVPTAVRRLGGAAVLRIFV